MAIVLQVGSADPDLLAAIRTAAWDLQTSTVVANHDSAVLSGSIKQRWQIAFNEAAGKAAVINLDVPGNVMWLDATSIADAAYQASRTSLLQG